VKFDDVKARFVRDPAVELDLCMSMGMGSRFICFESVMKTPPEAARPSDVREPARMVVLFPTLAVAVNWPLNAVG
jgi:hypothetical protein